MPPHDDLTTAWAPHIPVITTNNIGTGTDTIDLDGYTYTATAAYAADTVARAYADIMDVNAWTPMTDAQLKYSGKYIPREELDKYLESFARKVYKVFSEHIKLDITEEEFMDILE